MNNEISDKLPLAPATLQILLALSGEDLHGYGIMQEVRRQTEERYPIGPGTLYDNLQRLSEQALVAEVASPPPGADARRKYYRLTSSGAAVLAAEVKRLEGIVVEAKARERRTRTGEA